MYKVGDKIICINDRSAGLDLTKGNIYTILSISRFTNCIYLDEVSGPWSIERFRIYNRELKLKKILNV